MTERLYIGTHKGLFELARHNGVWDIADLQFLGDPVSAVLAVSDGIVYAALDLGHFGAKLLTTRCGVERYRSLVQRIIRSPRFTANVLSMTGTCTQRPARFITSRPPISLSL
jgi:hypothetical protein